MLDQVLNTAANLATIVGILYGVLHAWPDFVKQKKAEGLLSDSRQALEELKLAENALISLFGVAKNRRERDYNRILVLVHDNFRNLYHTLRFLEEYPAITHKIVFIREILIMLQDKYNPKLWPELSEKILIKFEPRWQDQQELDFAVIIELRQELIRIYHIGALNKQAKKIK